MRTAADHGLPVTVHVHHQRMRGVVQTDGRVVLVPGMTLLGLGLLPEDPDAANEPLDRSCPPDG